MDFEVRLDKMTSNDRAHSVNNYLPDFTDYCAKWILKTSETSKLTRTATVGIVEDVADLIKEVSLCLADQVKSCLTENGLDFNAIVGLSDVFSPSNEATVSFSSIMTFHQQLTYYKQKYNFIVSCCMCIINF